MDFMPLRLNSSSLTRSICALVAIILQFVAVECRKLHMVDLPIAELAHPKIKIFVWYPSSSTYTPLRNSLAFMQF